MRSRSPGAKGRYLAPQGEKRAKADPHLDEDGGDQSGAQKNQRHGEVGGESAHVLVHRRAILGRHEDDGGWRRRATVPPSPRRAATDWTGPALS